MHVDDLKKDMTSSLKSGDKLRLETLRFLLSAIQNVGIQKYGAGADTKITEADVMDVIKKQVKTHKESVVAFEKAGRTELADKEKKELDILSSFLPKEMTDEELKNILADVVADGDSSNPSANSGQAFGLLMKQAMAKVGGQADGARVSKMLQEMLKNK